MARLSRSLSERISQRYGVVTSDELIRDGLSRDSVRERVRAGALIRIHEGVYRLATAPDVFEARCVAACLADREAIITSVAGARLWEFRHVWRPDAPFVLVSHGCTPLSRDVTLCRSNVIGDGDAVLRADGIRVASPPRAWFDCARHVDDERFERLTEWVLDHHATLATLQRMVERMDARGRPGLARVKRVMAQRADWQAPADSGLELRVMRALEKRGIVLVRQYRLVLADGTVIHLDGADPTIRWGIEVDHVTWHGGRVDAQRDKRRDRRARLVGWQVERVGDVELDRDFDATINDLVRLHHQRRAEISAA